ncbi:MAG: hypothetical protein HY040_15610 [Planctomycetes bacterium]|nr:hypothetical protein [Planctomycetota bacterium]
MRFWIREIVGYLLIALGLAGMYFALALFANDRILAGSAFTVPAIFVFRGGIHLLKVAMAARICLHAHAPARDRQLRQAHQGPGAANIHPFDW